MRMSGMAMRDGERLKLGFGSHEMANQREAGEQAGNRERHRSQHVKGREPKSPAFIQERRIERARRGGGGAAENAVHQEQSPGLRRLALEVEVARDHAHDDRAGYVDDEGTVGKRGVE